MILYLSTASSYSLVNPLFKEGKLFGGYQAQKFNINFIEGLSVYTEVVSLSALPYVDINAEEKSLTENEVRYIAVKNKKGFFHKINNVLSLYKKGKKLINENHVQYIVCDGISAAVMTASFLLSKRFKLPLITIVTDMPELISKGKFNLFMKLDRFFMNRSSGYVFLTEYMREVFPKNKPYIVLEGSCDDSLDCENVKKDKKIIMYAGSLWKENAGIEYFTEGFIKAGLKDYELHFYGSGDAEEYLKEICEKNENVKYYGLVSNEEVMQKEKEAFLLVNPRPSDKDFCKYSFPSKTLEYMSTGTPVIMTKLKGIPEEYFSHAFTIEEETPEGVCKLLKEIDALSPEEIKRVGEDARKFVIENKNKKVQAEKLFAFIEDNF